MTVSLHSFLGTLQNIYGNYTELIEGKDQSYTMTVTVIRHEEQQQGISWSVTTSQHHNINEVE